jgi:hypothetical protein
MSKAIQIDSHPAGQRSLEQVQATARGIVVRTERHLYHSRGKALFPRKGHPNSSLSYVRAAISLRKKKVPLNDSLKTVSNPCAKLEIGNLLYIMGGRTAGSELGRPSRS